MTQTHKKELSKYKNIFESELHNILAFWIKHSLDKRGNSGFYGAVDLSGSPILTANKSCVLNSRILWTFSEASLIYNYPEFTKMAEIAYKIISNDFYDSDFGGYYMELSPNNKVINYTKHTYSQAFVLYSLCKYYELNPSEKVLDRINSIFELLENKTKDRENLGYLESFERDWNIINTNRMSENNEPKSVNTHLHLLMSYAALFNILKNDVVKYRLTELMNIFINNIIREDGTLGLFYNLKFEEVHASKSICSFGLNIEASWILWEAAEILNDEIIKAKILPLIFKMILSVKRFGLDEGGGLFLESTKYGSHLKTNKHWWIQAESLVGFMNAYQLTKSHEYWDIVKLTWNFIEQNVIDHDRGEWYTKVNRIGEPFLFEPEDDPSPYYKNNWKIDPWKAPYHNGRAMMEMVKRIDKFL